MGALDPLPAGVPGSGTLQAGLPGTEATEFTIRGVTLGVELPLVALALPVVLVALVALTVHVRGAGGDWSRRRRLGLLASRVLLATLLVAAAAGPYTVTARETPGDPRVRLLADESDSMAVTDANVDALAAAIEAEGVPVSRSVVGSGTTSRLGDAVVANTEPGAELLVVSDGQVTGGRSLGEAAEVAAGAGATVHAVRLSTTRTERYVTLAGPAKTSAGVGNSFLVRVGGTDLGSENATVTVTADGTPVFTEQISGAGAAEFTYTFDEVGTHEVVARVDSDDVHDGNDVVRRSVRVVPKPRVLYVARNEYPLEGLLDRLYNVTSRPEVPDDLDPYQAVVLQDLPADEAGNVTALQRAVIDGTGLVAVGGRSAYDNGGYANSSLGSMLPVSVGEGGGRTTRMVLLVDVSGSSEGGMETQKRVALDVLEQLGDGNEVGLVGFNWQAHLVNNIVPLGSNREQLRSKVRRLRSGGGTDLGVGLQGAADLLDGPGTVIVISDGQAQDVTTRAVARRLNQQGVEVVTVGVGRRVNEELLSDVAAATGGQYLRADETDRLRLLFGGESRTFAAGKLTVVDRNQFITAGVEPESDPGLANEVSVKAGAEFLVATGEGDPALAQWRYGLGRVVSVTAYGVDGSLDGLLERPDSLLLSKSVNWVVGDPERDARGVVSAPDARVGEQVTVRYVGRERPEGPPRFRQVAPETYEATLVPEEPGFRDVLGTTVAVNYPREYEGYGQSDALAGLVRTTGGQEFRAGEAAAIAETVRQSASRTREVRREWGWLLLAAALLLFLLEVAARRLSRYRRRTASTATAADD
ncbi:VWA domain-containing protein [Haloglomus litoreum]|uniref:VWA domain-containing protein n=1 Tax=Haloglomus litoreum TaxID=3034026 RepID=UPI0023E79B6B|nr:VWA domain-containing protein [Haloglomus sp. DT116]